MIVRFLGTAAGGGIPQWNCGCPGCDAARIAGFNRTQDTLAVSGDGVAWYLVNASPDLRAQLLATPELAPRPGTNRFSTNASSNAGTITNPRLIGYDNSDTPNVVTEVQ